MGRDILWSKNCYVEMSTKITDEITFQYVPSTGPGGQNVNKVATTAILKFDITHSVVLSERQRKRLYSLAGKKVNNQGILTIIARRFRSQEQNRKDAITRLENLVFQASKPEKKRHSTKPSFSSVQKRLDSKNIRSKLKQSRKTNSLSE
jgi:ribosome-associated protein